MSDVRRRIVHQPLDKSTKRLYGNSGITREFLCKHLPEWIVAEADMSTLQQAPTEHVDQKLRTVRHVDLVWKVWFRDSWLYLVLLFEFQATVDWLMPVRILIETGLAYAAVSQASAPPSAACPPVPASSPPRLRGSTREQRRKKWTS